MAKAEILKPFILSWEGGFSITPGDKGGATNKGITIATYRSVFGKERTVEDLKTITDVEWMHIYKSFFWDKWKADEIKLVYNEKDSTIKFSQIICFPFDLPKGQDNDFTVVFNKEDMKKGTYKCNIDLYANGKKITDQPVKLKIIVKE